MPKAERGVRGVVVQGLVTCRGGCCKWLRFWQVDLLVVKVVGLLTVCRGKLMTVWGGRLVTFWGDGLVTGWGEVTIGGGVTV